MNFLHTLNLDIETRSGADLSKCGLYKYVQDPFFKILWLCCSLDDGEVHRFNLFTDHLPFWVIENIKSPTTKKIAWNAMFERTCLAKYLDVPSLDPRSWECTMVKAGSLGLPMYLGECAIALQIRMQKLTVGKSLIRVFSIPQKPTKKNGFLVWLDPTTSPYYEELFEQFGDYCEIDVLTEMNIGKALSIFELIDREKKLYALDQNINDKGIAIDKQLIENAIAHSRRFTDMLLQEAIDITGLQNPKSVKQLKEWLELEIDETIPTLSKEAVHDLIKKVEDSRVKRVLEIRQQISKTSVKKYDAMLKYLLSDGRIKGVLRFYGANKTGRWAGSGPQLHNLYKNDTDKYPLPELEAIRTMERNADFDTIDMAYDTADVLAQLIRTAIVPSLGRMLCMSDFSAIEARVLAWYAQEKWKLDVFAGHGKIYEATGANMFKVPIEKITKGSHYRQRAKIAELACGYQGGTGALERMGAVKMGMSLKELPDIVGRWRDANSNIVKFWYDVEKFAIAAVRTGELKRLRNLKFYMKHQTLFIELPSGRALAYLKPKVIADQNGYAKLVYHGVDPRTFQWKMIPLYGGLLTENIVQATSRDIMAEKLLALDEAGFEIVLHVHDEIVCEVGYGLDNPDAGDIDEMECAIREMDTIMKAPLEWTDGLPLNADTSFADFYRKD